MKIRLMTAVLAAMCCFAWAADDAATAPSEATGYKPQATSSETDAITIPKMLSYQGKLTDTGGNPVRDSTYSVVFRLYTVPSGGTAFWNETQNVTTKSGLFSVLLGFVTPIGYVPDAGALYLGMQVGASELTPRLRLVSAAYAYKADSSAYAVAAAPVGAAGGDLAGTYPSPTLAQKSATTGQVLKWTGSAWQPRNDSVGQSGGGTVTSVSQATGVVCTPNPITATGTVGFDQTYGDGRYVNVSGDSMTGALAVQGDLRVYGKGRIGLGNSNSGTAAFVAGEGNTASANYSSVAGGADNTASGASSHIGGGGENRAGGDFAFVGGGQVNYASGGRSSVSGGSDNEAYGLYGAIGGGRLNTAGDAADDTCAVVAGGSGNSATADYATVGGGQNNSVAGRCAVVAGGYSNAADSNYSVVGGGYDNGAPGRYATVAGGYTNTAESTYATVGGGRNNHARGNQAAVVGGYVNNATGPYSFVGGGYGNRSSGDRVTVAGGGDNTADGLCAAVGGGSHNVATGDFATVPGGWYCEATGDGSFAAGTFARARAHGSFVWSDSCSIGDSVRASTRYSWVARARGGVYFYTSLDKSTGSYLSAGGSSWNSVSDSMTKENFRPVDKQALLEALARMRVRDYNLKSQDPSVRHIGPVAQDFHNAFGFGESNTAINMEDADGVLLAAVQALYEQNQAQQAEIEALKAGLVGKN